MNDSLGNQLRHQSINVEELRKRFRYNLRGSVIFRRKGNVPIWEAFMFHSASKKESLDLVKENSTTISECRPLETHYVITKDLKLPTLYKEMKYHNFGFLPIHEVIVLHHVQLQSLERLQQRSDIFSR